MKYFAWDNDKNQLLKAERNISFEEVVFHIEKKHLLDVVEHPNQEKYKGQKIFTESSVKSVVNFLVQKTRTSLFRY